MSHLKAVVIALLGLVLAATGCLGGPGDSEVDATGSAEQGIKWGNGSSPEFFWQASTLAALQQMAAAPLRDAGGEMASTPLLSSADGQSLLHYVVGCALPAGDTLTSAAAGASFEGAIGVAAGWASQPLSAASSQRWMTACLLATLNGLGQRVPIRMVGSHAALADDPNTDVSGFDISEATTFGNVFVPGQVSAYACVDLPVGLSCGLEWSSYSLERICGLSPTCGITSLGLCDLNCVRDAAGNTTCAPPQGDTAYAETISVKLDETGALTLYPLCELL